jgi:hypothetical protein
MTIDPFVHTWLNAATILVLVGAVAYLSLVGYMR